MVGSAAATLFRTAVNKASSDASNQTSSNVNNAQQSHTTTNNGNLRGRTTTRGRNGRLSRQAVTTTAAGGPAGEDVGMSDADGSAGANRRQRQGVRSGPMGQRPTRGGKGRAPLARSQPRVIKHGDETTGDKSKDLASSGAVDTLRLFLLSRYSAEAQMLNLENMAEDPILREAGLIAAGQKGAAPSMAGAMWKIAATEFPSIITISFANNGLKALTVLSPYHLTASLPNVENVSFAHNMLANVRDLDPFSATVGKARADGKSKGWPNLKELVLTGNPMVKMEGAEAHEYQVQVARRFARLTTLDQQPIDPSIAFQAKASGSGVGGLTPGLSPSVKKERSKAKTHRQPIVFPLPVAPGFFESEPTRDFVAGFLSKFFPAFDSDRPSLLNAYAPVCTFSFAINTTAPDRSKAKKIGFNGDKAFPNQMKLDWKPYLGPEGSRNLQRVSTVSKRANTIKTNPAKVISSIIALPSTQHPLDDPSKFVFDTWTMPGVVAPNDPGGVGETVIFAVVHGQFTESQAAGWPCVILSDLFVVRGYSDPKAFQPPPPPVDSAPALQGAMPGQASIPSQQVGVPAAAVQERAEGISDEQQSLILQLQQVTNLTYTFAHMALSQNNWDPQVTMTNFQALHASGTIPPEAFRQA
ncbi:nuclear mRNA export, poly(A)+RNA binding protein [Microbotryomycetes sp. JL221]|nr:nuclear mRNA export, poly(A)+RNA binding protein [Microbotryomycetes sp. JL221]